MIRRTFSDRGLIGLSNILLENGLKDKVFFRKTVSGCKHLMSIVTVMLNMICHAKYDISEAKDEVMTRLFVQKVVPHQNRI